MKIAFCIDDNPRYLVLLQGAVRSLRRVYGDLVDVVCVYAGNKPDVLQSVPKEGVTLLRYSPVLDTATVPANYHYAIGAFLKLELALVPELAAEDYILYCDVDVYFHQRFDALLRERPAYIAMAREQTAPFFHTYEMLDYSYRGKRYNVPMPFPIWTFSSGVAVFNLNRLRRHDYIHNFLAFCSENIEKIENLDQSLLNYFFGKRITKLPQHFNCPPYMQQSRQDGRIIHFHGPKPWDSKKTERWGELMIHHYGWFRQQWRSLFSDRELSAIDRWEDE